MAQLDPLIHAPARLQVVTTLSAVSEAEFATLRAALEVSDSVLSKHVSALADAGYVRSRKGVQAGRRTTWIGLTSACGGPARARRGTAPADRHGRLIHHQFMSTNWQRPLMLDVRAGLDGSQRR